VSEFLKSFRNFKQSINEQLNTDLSEKIKKLEESKIAELKTNEKNEKVLQLLHDLKF
jgi:SOS-response transcriptional repressor LexA